MAYSREFGQEYDKLVESRKKLEEAKSSYQQLVDNLKRNSKDQKQIESFQKAVTETLEPFENKKTLFEMDQQKKRAMPDLAETIREYSDAGSKFEKETIEDLKKWVIPELTTQENLYLKRIQDHYSISLNYAEKKFLDHLLEPRRKMLHNSELQRGINDFEIRIKIIDYLSSCYNEATKTLEKIQDGQNAVFSTPSRDKTIEDIKKLSDTFKKLNEDSKKEEDELFKVTLVKFHDILSYLRANEVTPDLKLIEKLWKEGIKAVTPEPKPADPAHKEKKVTPAPAQNAYAQQHFTTFTSTSKVDKSKGAVINQDQLITFVNHINDKYLNQYQEPDEKFRPHKQTKEARSKASAKDSLLSYANNVVSNLKNTTVEKSIDQLDDLCKKFIEASIAVQKLPPPHYSKAARIGKDIQSEIIKFKDNPQKFIDNLTNPPSVLAKIKNIFKG